MAKKWEPDREKRRAAYVEKLKDPRWQKKRLQVLERDKWTCQCCGDTEETLHVHHYWYENDKEPWDVDERALVTLCESCHETETRCGKQEEEILIRTLRGLKMSCHEILELASVFSEAKLSPPGEAFDNWGDVFTSLQWFISTPEGHQALMDGHSRWVDSRRKPKQ